MRLKTFIFVIFFIYIGLFSKDLRFKIICSKTNKELPFSNVILDKDKHIGQISDIDGNFSLNTKILTNDWFLVTYLGYKECKINVSECGDALNIIKLDPLDFSIPEVLVFPNENPAWAIIRKVRQNVYKNNPYKIPNFSCVEYNKLVGGIIPSENSIKNIDKLKKNQKDKDLIFSESIINKHFKRPDMHKLEVVANRFSGFSEKPMLLPTEEIQPFHFYDDYIKLLDKNYLNPLADRNFGRYNFILQDSIIVDGNMVYTIEFFPKNNLSFEGLKGFLRINSKGFAIENVVAEPNRKSLMNIKIEQKYSLINDSIWFPKELNYVLFLGDFDEGKIFYSGKNYISEVKLNNENDKVDFNSQYIEYNPNAVIKDTNFWNKHRSVEISKREKRTFQYTDSILGKSGDRILEIMEKLIAGKLQLGKIDIDIMKIYRNNSVEGNRFGIGLATNQNLNKIVSIGGFMGYGDKDKEYKYGGNLTFNVSKKYKSNFILSYSNDLKSSEASLFKDYFVYDYSKIKSVKAQYSWLWSYFDFSLACSKQEIRPYKSLANAETNQNVAEFEVKVDFDFYKRYMQSWIDDYRFIKSSSTSALRIIPKFDITYQQGISNILNGEYNYKRLMVGVSNIYTITKLGEFSFRAEAGLVDGDITYGKMFTGEGTFAGETNFLFDNVFQTVKPDEFASTRYCNLFLKHTFGSIPFKTEYIKPKFSIVQNIGFGEISKSILAQNPNISTMNKGLYESGLVIEDILRYKCSGLFYLTGGVGAFYRYGEYALPKQDDNYFYKIAVGIGF